jgi:hypothetical protein
MQTQQHSSPTERHHQHQHHHQPPNYHNRQPQQKQCPPTTAPIFSAHGVEWPLPSAFAPAQYRRYRRESKALGLGIGISSSGLRIGPTEVASSSGGASYHHHRRAESIGDRGVGGASAFASRTGGRGGDGFISSSEGTGGGYGSSLVGGGGGGGGGYGGLTGLMGRVLGASSSPSTDATGGSNLTSKSFVLILESSPGVFSVPVHKYLRLLPFLGTMVFSDSLCCSLFLFRLWNLDVLLIRRAIPPSVCSGFAR